MLTRRFVTAGVGLAMTPGLAGAATLPPVAPLALDPDETIATRRDAIARLTIPVKIGDRGPFRFVVDTGADSSVLSRDVADTLDGEGGPLILVHGIGGAEMTPTLRTEPLSVGGLKLRSGALPILSRARIGADGLLGVDVLQRRRLVMDFQARALRITTSDDFEAPIRGEESVVRALKRFGRLAVMDASADRVDVAAFIDSGAELSVGNLALAARLGLQSGGLEPEDSVTSLRGVTADPVYGSVRRLRRLQVGNVKISDLPLVFCDLHLFDLWGLKNKPAVLLGMNILQRFSRVELDYGARQVRFRLADASPLPGVLIARA